MKLKYTLDEVLDGFQLGDEVEWLDTEEARILRDEFVPDFADVSVFRITDKEYDDLGHIGLEVVEAEYECEYPTMRNQVGFVWCHDTSDFPLSSIFRLVQKYEPAMEVNVTEYEEVGFNDLF